MTFHEKNHNKRICFILLIIPIIFTSFYFVPSVKTNPSFLGFTMSGCWISGGINLIYSTKIESKRNHYFPYFDLYLWLDFLCWIKLLKRKL